MSETNSSGTLFELILHFRIDIFSRTPALVVKENGK